MSRAQLLPYVAFGVDDAMAIIEKPTAEQLARATLVGWQCGFEPMAVAVWSYLPNCTVDECDAEALAIDALIERGWFRDEPTAADYVVLP